MSRALGRGGLAHPAGILVVFVIADAWGRPRPTRLKQMTACAYFRTQLFLSDASSKILSILRVSSRNFKQPFSIWFWPWLRKNCLWNSLEEYTRSISILLLSIKNTKIEAILWWHTNEIIRVLWQWIVLNEVIKSIL